MHERKRLSGVHLYSLLCEELLGKRPKRVQLLYLKQPVAIITEPTDQSTRGTRRTLAAVWQAVERACEREDFRPKPSRLCDYCAFQAYCPSFGGDPDAARALSIELHGDPFAPRPPAEATEGSAEAPVPGAEPATTSV
jgi:putative RecB family exonuclease